LPPHKQSGNRKRKGDEVIIKEEKPEDKMKASGKGRFEIGTLGVDASDWNLTGSFCVGSFLTIFATP
jgi:hypothetical protein